LQADGFKVARKFGLEARRGNRLLPNDEEHRVHRCLALEGETAGQHLVQDDAQRVDVGRGADRHAAAVDLLGCHVVRRADDLAAAGQVFLVVERPGEAEVGDLGTRSQETGVRSQRKPGSRPVFADSCLLSPDS
jgi:hypothetical protein